MHLVLMITTFTFPENCHMFSWKLVGDFTNQDKLDYAVVIKKNGKGLVGYMFIPQRTSRIHVYCSVMTCPLLVEVPLQTAVVHVVQVYYVGVLQSHSTSCKYVVP